jgi:hypothetical protein
VEIVPVVEFPPTTPFTSQFTAVFVAFVTFASNVSVPKGLSVALPGVTSTVMVPVPAVVPAVVVVLLHAQSKKTAHSNPSKIFFPPMKTFSGNP